MRHILNLSDNNMATLPFKSSIIDISEALKAGNYPQSPYSPVIDQSKIKQPLVPKKEVLPQKKKPVGYVPLTREQFMKAQNAGFTPDQIIEMEKRRKSEMKTIPQAPKFDRSNPQQFVADYEQSVKEGAPKAF